MGYFDEHEHRHIYGRSPTRLRLAKQDTTCRTCGAPVYWQEVIGKDGVAKVQLFQNGKPHVCNHADDFDDLTTN